MANLQESWEYQKVSLSPLSDLPGFNICRYIHSVFICDKVYLYGSNLLDSWQLLELDLETLEYTDFVPICQPGIIINQQNITYSMNSYGEHIILLTRDFDYSFNLIKINTKTRIVEKVELENIELQTLLSNIGECIVGDQLYLFYKRRTHPTVCVVNLKTFKKTWIESGNFPSCLTYGMITAAVYKTDIFCFNISVPHAFVFNTLNNEWSEIENFETNSAAYDKIEKIVRVCDELFVFKQLNTMITNEQMNTMRYMQRFNLQIRRWKRDIISHPFESEFHFAPCQVYGKLYGFETIPRTKNLHINIFDWSRNLQCMCLILLVKSNIDKSRLPTPFRKFLDCYRL
ncbi:hypothetical protein CHUAL_009442 [Chamberlinius hualienensis]